MTMEKITQFKNLEDIVNSLEFLDHETLKKTLAYIIKIYIIDKGHEFEGLTETKLPSGNINETATAPLRSSSFSHLLSELKRTYTFPELDMFDIDNNNVYITLNGKKEVLSQNKVETPAPSLSKIPNNIKQQEKTAPGEQPARFKNLEMD